eukprot:gene1079-59197_t
MARLGRTGSAPTTRPTYTALRLAARRRLRGGGPECGLDVGPHCDAAVDDAALAAVDDAAAVRMDPG